MHPVLRALATPAAAAYRLGLEADRWWGRRRRRRLPVPVVSIGNLTTGGTGKTPLLLHLLDEARRRGRRPAVLTRGYRGVGNRGSRPMVLTPADPEITGPINDETLLLHRRFPEVPVGIGANRVAMADEMLRRTNPDLIVLDDGFQHWRLERDLDLVCVDASDPWGGGGLLPIGSLRESPSALRRAHAVVLTRCDGPRAARAPGLVRAVAGDVPVFRSMYRTALVSPLHGIPIADDDLKGRRVLAVSGLARPSSFEESLRRRGADVLPRRFRDHHDYDAADVGRLLLDAEGERARLVTTEKDWVKLADLLPARELSSVLVLRADLVFHAEDAERWGQFLDERLPRA